MSATGNTGDVLSGESEKCGYLTAYTAGSCNEILQVVIFHL